MLQVIRGNESWNVFPIAYAIICIFIIEIVNSIQFFYGYKFFVKILFLFIFFHLCFFNGWFRNKVINFYSKSKKFKE